MIFYLQLTNNQQLKLRFWKLNWADMFERIAYTKRKEG